MVNKYKHRNRNIYMIIFVLTFFSRCWLFPSLGIYRYGVAFTSSLQYLSHFFANQQRTILFKLWHWLLHTRLLKPGFELIIVLSGRHRQICLLFCFLSYVYRKVASSNTSRLEAHSCCFRLLVKGVFDPCPLCTVTF